MGKFIRKSIWSLGIRKESSWTKENSKIQESNLKTTRSKIWLGRWNLNIIMFRYNWKYVRGIKEYLWDKYNHFNVVSKTGVSLLNDPAYNKSNSFSQYEWWSLGLEGLLPY